MNKSKKTHCKSLCFFTYFVALSVGLQRRFWADANAVCGTWHGKVCSKVLQFHNNLTQYVVLVFVLGLVLCTPGQYSIIFVSVLLLILDESTSSVLSVRTQWTDLELTVGQRPPLPCCLRIDCKAATNIISRRENRIRSVRQCCPGPRSHLFTPPLTFLPPIQTDTLLLPHHFNAIQMPTLYPGVALATKFSHSWRNCEINKVSLMQGRTHLDTGGPLRDPEPRLSYSLNEHVVKVSDVLMSG